jgi:hypothetical protein
MKKLPILAMVILCLAVLPGFALAGPQIVIPGPAFQFGTLAEGDKVEHIFTIVNRGDEPLVIDRVRSTCGCTGTLLSQKEIPPGASGEVKTIFNSNGMRGPVVKWVYIYSNDPANPKTGLQITGIVKPEIDITPGRLRLTGIKPGEKREAHITLTNNSERTIFLSDLSCTPAALSAELSRTKLEPGATAGIRAVLTFPPGKAHQNGYITVSTSSPRTPKLRIPVFGVGQN